MMIMMIITIKPLGNIFAATKHVVHATPAWTSIHSSEWHHGFILTLSN